MIELSINFLIELPRTLKMLTLISCKDALHSLHQRLKLLAVHLSGKQSNIETFHAKLQILLRNCEECWIQNMTQFSVNNKRYDIKGWKSLMCTCRDCIYINAWYVIQRCYVFKLMHDIYLKGCCSPYGTHSALSRSSVVTISGYAKLSDDPLISR